MADGSAADKAYQAALREIERVRAAGEHELKLNGDAYAGLDRIPPEVAQIEHLSVLSLDDTRVSDLAPLKNLTALRNLYLDGTAISDLSHLRNLTGLQSLSLNRTAVSDLSPILGLTALLVVFLNQTAVNDLSPLRDLTALKALGIGQTAVSDLSPLRALTFLKSLVLTNTPVSNLWPLSGLTGLESLWLAQTAVSDLSPLRDLTALQTLVLAQTTVRDLWPLRGLTALEFLVLTQTAADDLSPLRGLMALHSLALDQSAVADLRPIVDLFVPKTDGTILGLNFASIPATALDSELRRLSEIADHEQRTRETLAYLRTLPPWPEPLPWLPNGTASSEPKAPSDKAAPVPLPAGLRRITLAEARHILVSDRPQLRARCQHVVAELDDALAIQAVRIPNEPEQLAAHTAITNSLTLAKAALIGLHDALPDDDLDRPVTEAEVTALRAAFDALIEKLKSAAAYVDRSDHTPTYGGILKTGCATAVASVLCLFPGISMAAAIPGVFAMLYGGPAAVKALGEIGKKAGGT